MFRASCLILLSLVFTACATPQVSQTQLNSLWNSAHFVEQPQVLPSADTIFDLGPELEAKIREARMQEASLQEKADFLQKLIFNPFLYEGYHSTIAQETWKKGRGDCMSLSILAYAIGKRLNLPLSVQEVALPVKFDRVGKVDYLNAHVNTIILNPLLSLTTFPQNNERGFLLIDFDPGLFTMRRGHLLNEQEVIGHFYNNLGAEAISKKNLDLAYTYLKASILAYPGHTPAYVNLANVYRAKGLIDQAIHTLEVGNQLKAKDTIILRELQSLYQQNKQTDKARALDQAIIDSQESNPYYWIGKGLYAMQTQNYHDAINYLKNAQNMTEGFEEVHQNLAIAYWRNGETLLATQHLNKLASINHVNPKISVLRDLGLKLN